MSFEPPNQSPFWKKPGRYWDLIPEVPFESYEEYLQLTNATADAYANMIAESLDIEEKTNQTLGMRNVHYGIPWDTRHVWAEQGTAILLKLTKGTGSDWCDLVNSFLLCILDATTRTYMHGSYSLSVHGFETAWADLSKFLQRQAQMFIKDKNLNPMGYYSFFFVNFKYYRSSLQIDHDISQNMPMKQFKAIVIAFAMGTHDRLGSNSCVGVLDDEMLRFIFKFEIFD